ncbi:hypothetical protein [Planococcus rifietoensis]|uniref:hypothetical protein n=1 Tax=Planococcus rifietoensis TaxID=200991 RepID=UPI00384E04E1
MIQVSIDEEQLKALYLQEVAKRIEEIEQEVFFMNSKQLQKYLNMVWNSIQEHLLHDPEFGAIRLGSKWLFHKREVDAYMQRYYEEVRDNGGDILKYRKVKK